MIERIGIQDSDGGMTEGEITDEPPASRCGTAVILIDGECFGRLELAVNGLMPIAETEEQGEMLKKAGLQHVQSWDGAYIESTAPFGHEFG